MASFTEGHYYGKGERPNTELADNSPFITGASYESKIRLSVTIKSTMTNNNYTKQIFIRVLE
ncbi:MAG: hypothetical protein JO297_07315 [Nitrososphaeraceae archaeon]|nr:hypothetical protein [Nitrososphaeraceae archaeon]